MKRVIIVLVMLLMFAGIARAENQFSPKINFAGDTIFLIGDRAFASGAGLVLGNFYKEIFEIKASYVFSHKNGVSDKVGVGIGLNAVKALQEIGVLGIPEWLNASVGILGLVDLKDDPNLSAGAYITIIKIKF